MHLRGTRNCETYEKNGPRVQGKKFSKDSNTVCETKILWKTRISNRRLKCEKVLKVIISYSNTSPT